MNPLAIAFAVTALSGSSLTGADRRNPGDTSAEVGRPAAPRPDLQDDGVAQANLDNGQNAAPVAAPPYHHWIRGQTLPAAYRSAPIADYARHHLRQPPYGYQWYLCGDQMVLASVDSGLIFEVIEGE